MGTPLLLYGIAGIMALIPAIIWLGFLLDKKKKTIIQIAIFVASIFTVVPVFILHFLLDAFPEFDVIHSIQSHIHDQNINFLLLFIAVGIVEEIVKQVIVRFLDNRTLLIHTINDSIHYSLIAALGFAFAENIFYIVAIYTQLGAVQVAVPYLFRAIFTTAAHLIFSGFFGYYYGLAKFTIHITEQSRWVGKKQRIATFLSSLLRISRLQAIKESTIMKGLIVAIIMHAFFNFLLQLNQIVVVALYIAFSFFVLHETLKRKSGNLILITDASEERTSSMAKKDQDVVIELLGMWFKDKRYVDVIHICERLMERDPDNKIIQLFKAKALDQMDANSAYGKILTNIFPADKKASIAEMVNKKAEQQKKNQQMPNPMPMQTPSSPPTTNKKIRQSSRNNDVAPYELDLDS